MSKAVEELLNAAAALNSAADLLIKMAEDINNRGLAMNPPPVPQPITDVEFAEVG